MKSLIVKLTISKLGLILLCISYGCDHIETPEASVSNLTLNTFINDKLDITTQNKCKLVFVIPNTGWSGCVNSSQSYVIEKFRSSNLKNILLIFTDIQDFKRLTKILGPNASILNHSNVIIDRKNELKSLGFVSFYPEVFFYESGKLKARKFITPENSDIFLSLDEHLST